MRGCEDLVLNPESYEYADRVSVERLEFEVKAVSKRISVVLGEDFERVREAIALAACIHDIGKALNHYQAILVQKCGSGEVISLAGHEVVSAIVSTPLFTLVLGDRRKASVFIAGIMLHHSARRSVDEAIEKLSALGVDLYKEVSQGIDSMAELIARNCRSLKAFITSSELLRVRREVLEKLSRLLIAQKIIEEVASIRMSKFGELVAYVVSIVDNIDAFISRRDEAVRGLLIKKFLKT
jgi:CRISPR-associated endonuclease Cas3-HD